MTMSGDCQANEMVHAGTQVEKEPGMAQELPNGDGDSGMAQELPNGG